MARSALDSDFFDLPTPRVIAHRGASGEYPENTLPAFRAAAQAGAPYFELDVHMTRDGVVVVSHDPELGRTCGLDAAIRDLTLAELKQADAGWSFTTTTAATTATAAAGDDRVFPFRGRGIEVPALAEVFAAFPERRYVIEIKQSEPSLAAPLLEVIERAGMRRRVLVAGEEDAPIDEIRALAPRLPTGFPYREIVAFMAALAPGAEPYQPRGDALQIPPEYEGWRLVTPQSLAAAHRSGIEVHVWTVNDAAEMRAMLELGVDAIITDYPARLLALL
ncbi:MAG TPA: glycerophosphodiester phosphodiesterase [Candidatus Binataceae bacterium]|nr:glycerophosphodiester phosphodiesterase [Candidatus Binataceae bacterium]